MPAWTPRIAAALIALVCWIGLGLQFSATFGHSHDVIVTLWTLARFFTIIANLALAIVMTRLAFGARLSNVILGGLTLALLLVGTVYLVLLRGLHRLDGTALLANHLLHYVSPLATAVYWLLFAPHGRLRWTAPLLWSLFPTAYFTYVIARGAVDRRYPYPFIDMGQIGLAQTILNALAIAAGFGLCGLALVGIDRRLGRGRSSG